MNQYRYRSLAEVRSIPDLIDVICELLRHSLKVEGFKSFFGLCLLLLRVFINICATNSYLGSLYLDVFATHLAFFAFCCRLSLRRF